MSRLGDVFNLVGGGTPATSNEEYWGSGTPWISSADIDNSGCIVYRRRVTSSGITNSTTNVVPKGTVIVVTRVGLGKVAQLTEDTCFSQDIQALIAKETAPEYSARYLMYQLLCIMQTVRYSGRGTTISGITKKQLADVSLYLPPLPEQERIVARIEELFSQLDAGVETLKKTKAQLAVYRQAAISYAFPDIPQDQWKRLDEIAEIIGGITKGRDLSGHQTIELPYLRVANVQNGYLDLSEMKTILLKESEKEQYLLKEGDVLYTEGGDRDKLGRGTVWHNEIPECVHQNHVFKARIRDGVALPDYVSYWSMSTFARNYFFAKGKQSVNLASINKSILSALTLPVPSVKVQKEVLNSIEMRVSVCNSIEQSVDLALQQSQALRQSILKQAFEGGKGNE